MEIKESKKINKLLTLAKKYALVEIDGKPKSTPISPLEIEIISVDDNRITIASKDYTKACDLVLSSKDILKLLTWYMGQEKHKLEQQARTDTDRENQKIVYELVRVGKSLRRKLEGIIPIGTIPYTETTDESARQQEMLSTLVVIHRILSKQ